MSAFCLRILAGMLFRGDDFSGIQFQIQFFGFSDHHSNSA